MYLYIISEIPTVQLSHIHKINFESYIYFSTLIVKVIIYKEVAFIVILAVSISNVLIEEIKNKVYNIS